MKQATSRLIELQGLRSLADEPVLAYIDAEDLDAHMRTHGMYPRGESVRDGVAAFTVRSDVTLWDVLETVDSLLRQAEAVASVMACDANADPAHVSAADAVSGLLRQARGLNSLVLPVVSVASPAGSRASLPKG